jgi:hypothetical protein
MTNPTELLRSRYGEIPFNSQVEWNDSLTHYYLIVRSGLIYLILYHFSLIVVAGDRHNSR